jgi:hypothetical protein
VKSQQRFATADEQRELDARSRYECSPQGKRDMAQQIAPRDAEVAARAKADPVAGRHDAAERKRKAQQANRTADELERQGNAWGAAFQRANAEIHARDARTIDATIAPVESRPVQPRAREHRSSGARRSGASTSSDDDGPSEPPSPEPALGGPLFAALAYEEAVS